MRPDNMHFRYYLVVLLFFVSSSLGSNLIDKLSNTEWLCANENCSEPISLAKPKQQYVADHNLKVGFNTRDIINIHGKPTSQKVEFWLVSVGNKYGVAPTNLLKEYKILINSKDCTHASYDFNTLIHSDVGEITPKANINPSPTHEVIDGTTIHYKLESDEEEISVATDEDSEIVGSINDVEETSVESSVAEDLTGNHKTTSTVPDLSDTVQPDLAGSVPAPQEVEDVTKVSESPDNVIENNSAIDLNDTSSNEPHMPEKVADPADVPLNGKTQVENENSTIPQSDVTVNSEELTSEDNVGGASEINAAEQTSGGTDKLSDPINSDSDQNENVSGAQSELKNELGSSGDVNSESSQSEPLATATEKSPTTISSDIQSQEAPDSSTMTTAVPPSVPYLPNVNESDQIKSESLKLSNFEQETTTVPPPKIENIDTKMETPEHLDAEKQNLEANYTFDENVEVNETSASPVDNASLLPEKVEVSTDEPTDSFNESSSAAPVDSVTQQTPMNDTLQSKVPESMNSYETTERVNLGTQRGILEASHYVMFKNKDAYPPIAANPPNSLDTSNLELQPHSSGDTNEATISPPISNENPLPKSEIVEIPVANVPSPAYETPSSVDREVNSPELSEITKDDGPSATDFSPPEYSAEIIQDSSENWFSPVSSILNSIKDMFSKSDIGVDDSQTIQEFTTEPSFRSYQATTDGKDSVIDDSNQSCVKDDGYCNISPGEAAEESLPFSLPGLEGANVSGSTLLYVMCTSSFILLFSLGYYYLENLKRDTELVAKINSLSAELFFAQKELTTMEEQMSTTSENFQELACNTTVNNEELLTMRKNFEESEAVKRGLEAEVKRLEKEIESLVENNDEMHKMLTESITEEDRTQSLLANIADLKSVLSERLEEIAAITDQLDKEKQEVELLTIALQKSSEQKESLEEKLQKVLNEIDSKALAVTKEFEEKVSSLEKIIEEISIQRTNFEKELCGSKAECEKFSAEKELLEKALKKAQGIGPGKALSEWLDAKEAKVELIVAQKEVDKLRRELAEVKEHEARLQDQKSELQLEIERLNDAYETAEKNKIEALTKVQVLSNYFKEQETQMKEELGEKKALWLQKQSEDHTIYEQMRSLREENLSYKAQNEALKKEILDQESSFKIQIANEEQKSQEHWVNLRHTERRLKEAQMETAHLRSRLTAHETNPESHDDKHKSLEMVDGEVGLGPGSPPFMLYPPPPPDFIPPPPLVSPSRPPPLGRLSSPPLTPPPPLSHFDLFPPSPHSPPTHRGVLKPQPRDPGLLNHRKQKESQSSNHSSESMEKPIRRGKR